ncbi:MAG: hypothetical protein ACD_61C00186G0018 [uncultured bacterium]|nr:MAG: hypothetical protein ACD_61C00186G0018 [uncultured bacterium]
MRLSFYNPHTSIGRTFISFVLRKAHNKKNDLFLDIIKSKPCPTALVVDGTASSITSGSSLIKFISDNYFLLKIISFLEIYIWCWLNGLNPFKEKIIFDKNYLDKKRDLVFGFCSLTDTFLNDKVIKKSFLKTFKGKKLLHATHYFGRTAQVAKNVQSVGVRHLLGEANIAKNSFFRKYFSFIKKVYVLPFVLKDRYQSRVPFAKRSNKCFAVGTLLLLSDTYEAVSGAHSDYMNFFHTNALHTMRKEIYEKRDIVKKYIDCFISPQTNEKHSPKKYFYSGWAILKIWASLTNSDLKKYHSFDIVEKYNQYKMFVCPEENIGLPSINFIEGMACGCAYIGLDSYMYKDLGLQDGVNYIAYDGTLAGLTQKIKYYQAHQTELRNIAQKGRELVVNSFKEEDVTLKLIRDMEKFVRTSKLESSFVVENYKNS